MPVHRYAAQQIDYGKWLCCTFCPVALVMPDYIDSEVIASAICWHFVPVFIWSRLQSHLLTWLLWIFDSHYEINVRIWLIICDKLVYIIDICIITYTYVCKIKATDIRFCSVTYFLDISEIVVSYIIHCVSVKTGHLERYQ